VNGWQVQQFLKIAATNSLPHQRYCILDPTSFSSAISTWRALKYPNSIPLLTMANAVTGTSRAIALLKTSHHLLGLPTPSLPHRTFIGHIIFWDQQTTAR